MIVCFPFIWNIFIMNIVVLVYLTFFLLWKICISTWNTIIYIHDSTIVLFYIKRKKTTSYYKYILNNSLYSTNMYTHTFTFRFFVCIISCFLLVLTRINIFMHAQQNKKDRIPTIEDNQPVISSSWSHICSWLWVVPVLMAKVFFLFVLLMSHIWHSSSWFIF